MAFLKIPLGILSCGFTSAEERRETASSEEEAYTVYAKCLVLNISKNVWENLENFYKSGEKNLM